jgi:hypothetical protein
MSKAQMRSRELYQRVAALHRTFEGSQHPAPKLRTQPTVAKLDEAHPHSLDHRVRREVERFGWRSATGREGVTTRAKLFALQMQQREGHPAVLARFGVERALDELLVFLNNMTINLPAYFVAGKPFTRAGNPEHEWGCLSPRDLDTIKRLDVPLDRIKTTATFPATWSAGRPSRMLRADTVRPPMEAVALAAQLIRRVLAGPSFSPFGFHEFDLDSLRPVLCIGTGFAATAQALSALLPLRHVYHLPRPLFELPVARQLWDAIIVNIPSRRSWRVAWHIGMSDRTTFVRRRAVLQTRHGIESPLGHIGNLLMKATRHRVGGKVLVLMGDPPQHHEAVSRLRAAKLVEPLVVEGIDTSERPIWVGYDKQPWAPHGLPRPTGKLVSIWRWK